MGDAGHHSGFDGASRAPRAPKTFARRVDAEVIPQQGSFVRGVYRAAALSP